MDVSRFLLLVAAAVFTVALQRFDPGDLPEPGPFPQAMQPGEKEIRGLAAAWPGRISEIGPRHGSFLAQLAELNGYNYRFVDGTRSRSLHSYGTAIDLIPRRPGSAYAYWRWAMDKVPAWWRIPYERRWMPPEPLVRAFERQGFVWGGKWFYFDTMHFEYRPEILRMRSSPGALTRTEGGEEY